WRLLEINDSPLGLAQADKGAEKAGVFSVLPGRSTRALAEALASAASGKGVVVVLPRGSWDQQGKCGEKAGSIDDAISRRANMEFEALSTELERISCPFEFRPLDEVELSDTSARTATMPEIGCLYTNLALSRFPPHQTSVRCVND